MAGVSGRRALILAALLFAVAMIGSLAAGYWLVAAVWLPVALLVLGVRYSLLRTDKRKVWLAVLGAAILLCLVLVFEGGLFVLPAALALLFADAHGGNGRGQVAPSGS